MRRLTFLFVAFLAFPSLAQTGYKFEFHIKGLKDTTVLLGYYFGEGTFIKDTARSDHQGRFVFDGVKALDPGIYFLAVSKPKAAKLFDPGFVVDADQHFLMETSTEEYVKFMNVTGSEDNTLFFENITYNAERHKEAEPFIKIIQDSTLKEDQKKDARKSFAEVSKRVLARQDEVIAKYPKSLTARLLKVTRSLEIPEPPKNADGSIDTLYQIKYYRKHYFDNFDLADDALIRLPKPFYMERIFDYLDRWQYQSPDSIMAAIHYMVTLAKKNKETYKYVVWSCLFKYQKPKTMGMDEVYVRLYDTYCATGEMDYWMNAQLKKNVKESADKLRPSLVGKMGANLIMQDDQFKPRSLYDIKKKYSIIYIFDPDCGHCREESPKLVAFYNKNKEKFGLEVYAVSTDSSMQKMRNYVKEMKMTWTTVNGPRSYVGSLYKLYFAETTPQVYILDDKHKIIAKGLEADRLEDFITNYERYMQRKSAPVKAKGS